MATKLLRFVEKTTKRYTAEVVLGIETSTLDASGDVTASHPMHGVTVEHARDVVARHLTGPIEQIPPMVSAIRVGGRRLHELARQGIEVERTPRQVEVYAFDVEASPDPGVLAIDVACSAGTYVRTLAADMGRLLGGGAHLRNLRRTAVGEFTLAEAGPPDVCELLPVEAAVRSLPRVAVAADVAALIANGRVLPAFETHEPPPWAVFDGARLIAVYEPFGDRQVKPAVVLPVDRG
jgi:tRNA pseudouridine55 synthase